MTKLFYKVFIDKQGGAFLESGETYDTLKQVTKSLKEKYDPYTIRREMFPIVHNCYVFFVSPEKAGVTK